MDSGLAWAPMMKSLLAGDDDKVTFAMAYHDVSWEIPKRMVDAGMLARSRRFARGRARMCR